MQTLMRSTSTNQNATYQNMRDAISSRRAAINDNTNLDDTYNLDDARDSIDDNEDGDPHEQNHNDHDG